ncbi:MAG: STAS domain-containing protein [Spirochaetes bacterium]|nr:STAS domain-containing protein [Spirochaetota bacterium]
MVQMKEIEGIPCALITAAQLHMYFIPDLKEKLLATVATELDHLIIDLTQVEYLDSSAMGVLFQVQKKMQAYGGALYLVGINATIEMVFKLTKSDQHFTVYADAPAAARAIQGKAE